MQFQPRRSTGPALALLFLALGSTSAEAHSDLRMGPFAGGILHPFETLPHLLILVSLGLLLGRNPPFRLRPLLVFFAPVAAAALLLTLADHAAPVPAPITIGLAFCLGLLLASGRPTPIWADRVLLAISALVIGLDSGFANPSALVVGKVLFANGVCLLVVIGYVAFYTSILPPRPWVRTAFRIVGSWIIAISLLLLAFHLKRP
jgi:hydrogenase/urease accessory protein HupE